MASKYNCFLFDVDNTLLDTGPLIRSALEECGCPHVDQISDRDIRFLSPSRILSDRGQSHLTGLYWQAYDRMAGVGSRLFDSQTGEVLTTLRERGISLGVVTSCRKSSTVRLLKVSGILEFFADCLVTYGTCSRRKPSAEPLLCAMKRLGQSCADTIYIGDSEQDSLACRSANVHLGVPKWAGVSAAEIRVRRPAIVISRMSDLVNYAR
ncbi:MAG: HAD-IA family hydrolase [Phycisphaerae bacterium]|nr:HAD-IA family hydrolase [Phycisphaerae bacterium]